MLVSAFVADFASSEVGCSRNRRTKVELAPGLGAGHQDEQRHRAAVDPVAQVQGRYGRAEADREVCCPEAVIPAGAMLAQISAAATATTRSRALAVSVRMNARSWLADVPRIDICGSCLWLVLNLSAAAGAGGWFMLMV